ncbi:hypothetical protein [Peribacillus asahii]|uniref:hypothetical protein n=1 Tax=Peribacillus asahii TaxID=228899 RepID=UPI002079ACF2|nr:hypothetical protein [Peribacillus asahii]USK72663.1 hypothetical protein LIS76_23345 [Peribacillus asahii]USK72700.1 hypothetical protein LIS76_23925 [Peribacillus asahii]
MTEQVDDFKKIEKHLKNYKKYKIGIKNMQKQIDFCLPAITTSYEPREGTSGTFTFHSGTEDYAIKRIEKKEELENYIKVYGVVIDSIDSALEQLDQIEKTFVKEHYFDKKNIKSVSFTLGCSVRNTYTIKEKVKENFMVTLVNLIYLDL